MALSAPGVVASRLSLHAASNLNSPPGPANHVMTTGRPLSSVVAVPLLLSMLGAFALERYKRVEMVYLIEAASRISLTAARPR